MEKSGDEIAASKVENARDAASSGESLTGVIESEAALKEAGAAATGRGSCEKA